jgi:ssDNA-binding Zn-finger/Zn-ribbon topoisomerase 1
MEMEKNDWEESKRLLSLSVARGEDVNSLQNIMRKYVDKHIVICPKCKGQIRFAMNRFRNWWNRFNPQPISDETNNTTITDDTAKNESSDVKVCKKCGKELSDKRRKVCVECKNA